MTEMTVWRPKKRPLRCRLGYHDWYRAVTEFGPWGNRQLVGLGWGSSRVAGVHFRGQWLGTFPEDFRGVRLCAVS